MATELDRLDGSLLAAFGLLFVVVALASVLPTRPVVWLFPFWSVVVLAAVVLSTGVAVVAVVWLDWPHHRKGSR